MKNLNTVLKEVAYKGNVKFPIKETKVLLSTSIDDLDLDTRSCNALHRVGFETVQEVLNNLEKIHNIRNCGSKSINRILYKICCYYYNTLSESEKKKYLMQIIKLNTEN